MTIFTDNVLRNIQEQHWFLIVQNIGSVKEPKLIYYKGTRTYPHDGEPAGPIQSLDKKDAQLFPTEEHARNVIGGDPRLQGSVVEAL